MALSADEVLVALTGGVFMADAGSALPTDAVTPLDGGYTELGYISEDGVTESQNETNTQIRAWQGGDTVRVVKTEHNLTYSFTAIESTEAVVEAFYGNYDAGLVEINAAPGKRGRWVIQVIDGDKDVRIVIPDGEVTERGDVQYVNSTAVGYPITITCYPDPDYSGTSDYPAKAYKYLSGTGS